VAQSLIAKVKIVYHFLSVRRRHLAVSTGAKFVGGFSIAVPRRAVVNPERTVNRAVLRGKAR